jgi:hypothetical protein
MIKIKLQINGESNMGQNIEDLEKYGMHDSEYEIDMELPTEKDFTELMAVMDRVIDTSRDNNFFNWHILQRD